MAGPSKDPVGNAGTVVVVVMALCLVTLLVAGTVKVVSLLLG